MFWFQIFTLYFRYFVKGDLLDCGNNYEIPIIFHLLDDFLTVQPSNTAGHKTMALLTIIFNRLNIPISEKKTIGSTTCLEYLGIILDTESMEA